MSKRAQVKVRQVLGEQKQRIYTSMDRLLTLHKCEEKDGKSYLDLPQNAFARYNQLSHMAGLVALLERKLLTVL